MARRTRSAGRTGNSGLELTQAQSDQILASLMRKLESGDAGLDGGKRFTSSGLGGRWATAQLKAAASAGEPLSPQHLRTLDTLQHEEWKYFDNVMIEEAKIRLVGVADLMAAGNTVSVPNALGKTVYGFERVTDMDDAVITLDGRARTTNDITEVDLSSLPLPITHKDFFINLRQLAASRTKGEPLDTTRVRFAARKVAERAEKMLFQGGPTFGGLPIYGYMTHPDRIQTVTFDGGDHWGDTGKLGPSYLKDLLAAISALQAQRQFGPYGVYMPTDAGVVIDNDYNAGTANIQSIRQRLMQVTNVVSMKVADQLPSGNLIVVQLTPDVASWVMGETLQTIQWDEGGGFTINFKAFQIQVPLIRSDIQGRCGVCHLT